MKILQYTEFALMEEYIIFLVIYPVCSIFSCKSEFHNTEKIYRNINVFKIKTAE